MKSTLVKPALTELSPATIFSKIAAERGAVWLDSSTHIRDKGRYSLIARSPIKEIVADSNNLDKSISEISNISKNKSLYSIGFFSYEGTLPFCGITPKSTDRCIAPLAHFFVYDSVLIYDRFAEQFLNFSESILSDEELLNELNLENDFEVFETSLFPNVSKEEYLKNVLSIIDHIKEGDIYQANYTCRFDAKSYAKPFRVYENLRKLSPAPYSCFINFGDYQIISSSPERMFRRIGDTITTCPIKGTVSSGSSFEERTFQKEKLLRSDKDKAELLMIVDLMRNDLGKVARTGSVEVSNLFSAEEYTSLFHLVTDVSAKLRDGIEYSDIFSALMPGGSITGAPKKRAVEILQHYESAPRGIYTGCIGYIHGETAEFNIAIRTMTHKDGIFNIHAGGGIVADSEPESEYQEMLLKAKNLFHALGVKTGR